MDQQSRQVDNTSTQADTSAQASSTAMEEDAPVQEKRIHFIRTPSGAIQNSDTSETSARPPPAGVSFATSASVPSPSNSVGSNTTITNTTATSTQQQQQQHESVFSQQSSFMQQSSQLLQQHQSHQPLQTQASSIGGTIMTAAAIEQSQQVLNHQSNLDENERIIEVSPNGRYAKVCHLRMFLI